MIQLSEGWRIWERSSVESRGSRVEGGAGPAKPERSEVRPSEICFALHGPREEGKRKVGSWQSSDSASRDALLSVIFYASVSHKEMLD